MRRLYGATYGVILLLVMSLPRTAVAETPSFDPDQPFRQAFTSNLLRAMLNKTLDLIENHLEIAGDLGQEDAAGERQGQFSIKVYPHGKSQSDEHLAAEGSFRLSPDLGRQDFHLRLERPKHSGGASARADDVL
jgi:hypothetical protein